MSVEVINGCIPFPHWANWRDGIKWSRGWRTEITQAVTGAADKATGQTFPNQTISYTVHAFSPEERARLEARIQSGLKSGRCVVPNFARAQYARAYPVPVAVESILVANTYEFNGLEVGKLYAYEAGPNDTQLNYAASAFLYATGYFVAGFTQALLTVTSLDTPGTIKRVQFFDYMDLDGLWPWAAGQYAFFLRKRPYGPRTHEKRAWLLNCGGGPTVSWISDSTFASGGSSVTTVSAINTSLVPQPAEIAVYQSARNYSGTTASDIVITVAGLHPDVPCRLRLHFAEIEAGFDGSTNRRNFDVEIVGGELVNQVFQNVEPWFMAGKVLNKAVFLDVLSVMPFFDGTLQVKVKAAVIEVAHTVSSNFDLAFPFSGDLGANVLLKSQTTGSQNGIYVITSGGILQRVRGGSYGRAVHVGSGSAVSPNTYWRVTTAEPINPGTTAVTYAVITNAFNSGINGIEFYQCLWDCPLLVSGSTANKVKFNGFLKGVYDVGSPVFPAFFGKPSIQNPKAHTDTVEEIQMQVSEPLGEGSVAVPGLCPVEVCYDDEMLAPPIITPPVDPGSFSCGPGTHEADLYPGPQISHAIAGTLFTLFIGVFDGTKSELTEAQVTNWNSITMEEFVANIDQSKVHGARAVWVRHEAEDTFLWNANFYLYPGEPNFIKINTGSGVWWSIAIQYCYDDA